MLKQNEVQQEFPAAGLAHLLFERQARERPDAVALRWRDGTMTYADLNRWANKIAWKLRDLGVAPEVPVIISTGRGPAMVAAVFGVLKAGGFYVPAEPSLPADRAAAILATTGAAVLLTTADIERWEPPREVDVVAVDQEMMLSSSGEVNPPPLSNPADLAYVIFTSGSTGEPKGVAIRHFSLLHLLSWCGRDFGFGPEDVGLCVASLGFDLSAFDILGMLGFGASLYIADAEQQRDPELLVEILLQESITFWDSAPAALDQLAPLLASRVGHPGVGDLRLVFLSGDYTPLPLPDAVRAVFPKAEIVSLGGATEATVWSNYFRVGEIDPQWRSIPYGRPVAGASYYVIDEQLGACPPGVEGDLYIGGDCLASGYFARPKLTAERFVADPFASCSGTRMYRTGDRAAVDLDGLIWFLGRSDNQVKIRGFRVELGEIEHRLRQHDGVRHVVVLARDDANAGRRLVAYVQPEWPRPSVAELREFAAQTLPDYMVPNLVTYMDTFPVTPNGKLDRAALQ
ncbi:amino acid adenylation domain-containing protein [Nocardia sp. NPDC050378]|uniref:non-ribosomal peptide synthetase n=1 Tax=Nocardia sp. NPDC050378 TaxID=3155400 RepID=UPI0033C96153